MLWSEDASLDCVVDPSFLLFGLTRLLGSSFWAEVRHGRSRRADRVVGDQESSRPGLHVGLLPGGRLN